MLESIFILLLVLAVLFLIITVIWQSLAIGIIDVILWIILSISVHQIELPYQAIQNDNTIVTGVQTVETLYMFSYFFMGIGIIVMIYVFVDIIFPMLQGRFSRMM